jgi:adenylate cyclase
MMLRFNLASRLRLASGLLLLTFVVTHLLNHAAGLVSLNAMLAGQRLFAAVWHSLPATTLLAVTLVTHLSLVLYKQVVRHTLRMHWVEALRVVLGVVTLYTLLLHATKNLVYRLVYGTPVLYPDYLLGFWPEGSVVSNQVLLVSAAWIHGCIGVHLWLRLRPGYRRLTPLLLSAAVLLPVLALLGAVSGEREALARLSDPAWLASLHQATPIPDANLGRINEISVALATGVLLVLVLARLGYQWWRARRGFFTVRYPGDRRARLPIGATVLEASRAFGIPHANVCGGRGRCSTCRVHVDDGLDQLPAASADEARVLQRIRAAGPVRLACQLRPRGDISVTLLVPPTAGVRDARPFDRLLFGAEREIVILFADLRGFTKMSETKLPYDVVHILNQYFAEMGRAIESSGGHLDKFIGDGIMALFGLRSTPAQAANQALAAARAMGDKMADLNRRLAPDLVQPLKVGIGIHGGTVIVGEMGYGQATTLTAIGDAVNVASRLESATKEENCQVLVSEEVARRGGVAPERFPLRHIVVRGRNEPLGVFAIASATDIPQPGNGAAAAS